MSLSHSLWHIHVWTTGHVCGWLPSRCNALLPNHVFIPISSSRLTTPQDFAAGSPLGFDERRGNYNVGMVGARH